MIEAAVRTPPPLLVRLVGSQLQYRFLTDYNVAQHDALQLMPLDY